VLQAVLDAGVTCISVGHRPSLLAFHKKVLLLGTNAGGEAEVGAWRVVPSGEQAAMLAAQAAEAEAAAAAAEAG
jgi:ABC-type uncharacterized transport system fused permease/ATPase subunit